MFTSSSHFFAAISDAALFVDLVFILGVFCFCSQEKIRNEQVRFCPELGIITPNPRYGIILKVLFRIKGSEYF